MLTINDIAEKLGLDLKAKGDVHKGVTGCYISDLLSDVMANSKDHELWVTLQTHPNVVAVAAIKGISGVIITNGRSPEADTLKRAAAENVTIMTSPYSTFELAGLLYNLLKNANVK
ncbi:MAG: DRTGG domain-containing protein [Nitrospirae bacterium]|nr:DRTGG domain-containing protein [Nitrospirota bacterium]MCL5238130.1 DRTGG domain-containing protein [Nitrospirota bacterium]